MLTSPRYVVYYLTTNNMSDDINKKVEDHTSTISATSTGEVKKLLEGRWLKSGSFTNISEDEFEGMWDGVPYVVAAGKTEMFALPLAEHLAAALASLMISKDGKIPSDNIPLYKETVDKILGKETVDFSAISYAEMQEMATERGINITKTNGKPMTKSELVSLLSK